MFRNKTIAALGIFTVVLFLTGCGGGVTQEQYDQISTENAQLQSENAQLQSEKDSLSAENQKLLSEAKIETKSVDAKLTGGFVATVLQLMPDYVSDDTPRIALLKQFQDSPFLFRLNDEILPQIKAGESYYFEIEDYPVSEIKYITIGNDDYIQIGNYPIIEIYGGFEQGSFSLDPGASLPYTIKSVRPPNEDETGVNSPSIMYQAQGQNGAS